MKLNKFTLQLTIILGLLTTGLGQVRAQNSGHSVDSKTIRVLVVSNLSNYVEPCGCTVDVMLGGLDRLVASSEGLSKTYPTLKLVVGHTFSDPFTSSKRLKQHREKSKLLAKGLRRGKFKHLINPEMGAERSTDFSHRVQEAGLEYVSSPTPVNLGSKSILLLPVINADIARRLLTHPPPTLNASDLVIAVSSLPRRETKRWVAQMSGIDVIILTHEAAEKNRLVRVHSGYLLEAGDRGRHLAILDIALRDAAAAKGDGLSYQAPQLVIPANPLFKTSASHDALASSVGSYSGEVSFTLQPLDSNAPSDLSVKRWIKDYTASLESLYAKRTTSAPVLTRGDAPFSGVEQCADCHPEAVEFWSNTSHSKAWSTLEKLNKTFDAECVGCHVTGWQESGGARIDNKSGLENVQCEVCHGAGKKHAESGGDKGLIVRHSSPSSCQTCHNKHHSPRFSYEKYLRQIIGPGHGFPK